VAFTSVSGNRFLNKSCSNFEDCIITPGVLHLGCFRTAGKCNCGNNFASIHNLDYTESGQCLMFKFGHCGRNKAEDLEVGCQEGFVCIDRQCRDPSDPQNLHGPKLEEPFSYAKSCIDGCEFSPELPLKCGGQGHCICEREDSPGAKSTAWGVQNYVGNSNCSVNQFGPCGLRNGLRVDCVGEDFECLNGTCTFIPGKLSGLGGYCKDDSGCEGSLICSARGSCIKKSSGIKGAHCERDIECEEGRKCESAGIWCGN